MANKNDEKYDAIERANELRKERVASYKALYTRTDAQRLGNAYMRYPWVNPEILVSIVLSGNDSALPEIAEYAAFKMAEAGYTPGEMSRQENMRQKFSDQMLYNAYQQDPSGGVAKEMVREGLRNKVID